MSDDAQVQQPEIVQPDQGGDDDGPRESIEQPGKIMRIGSMIKQLLDEVRTGDLDESSRDRLSDIYATSINELRTTLSPDLADELDRLTLPFVAGDDTNGDGEIDAAPSASELRIAQAQLVGWLEGLFQGIQATMFAQQMAARQQLEQMRQGQLPPGAEMPQTRPGGTYL